MAILIEQEKKNNPIFITVIAVVAVAVLAFGTYYVFIKPTPGIEKATISIEMQSVAQVSKINFDVSSVTDSPVYKSLKQQVSPPGSTLFGRQNPYISF